MTPPTNAMHMKAALKIPASISKIVKNVPIAPKIPIAIRYLIRI